MLMTGRISPTRPIRLKLTIMKLTKLSHLLLAGIILTTAACGCRKTPTDLTRLPGYGPGKAPKDDDTGGGFKPGETPIATGGGETSTFDLSNYNEDREALAAQTVHFAFDSSAVNPSERPKVEAVSSALKSDPAAKLLIEGHCDERGTEEYNRSLGERRALALRESLATSGVDPMRIRTVSYGEDKPVATGHDESAWKQNRRGVFVLLHPK
jgi:peptidoglycan-associated lipoprotein